MSQIATMSFTQPRMHDTRHQQPLFQVPPFNNLQSPCSQHFNKLHSMGAGGVAEAVVGAVEDVEDVDRCHLLTTCAMAAGNARHGGSYSRQRHTGTPHQWRHTDDPLSVGLPAMVW